MPLLQSSPSPACLAYLRAEMLMLFLASSFAIGPARLCDLTTRSYQEWCERSMWQDSQVLSLLIFFLFVDLMCKVPTSTGKLARVTCRKQCLGHLFKPLPHAMEVSSAVLKRAA